MTSYEPSASQPSQGAVLADHAAPPGASRTNQDHRLATIFEIARILVSVHDPEAMVTRFLCRLVETLDGVETGVLVTLDPATGELVVRAAQGYDLAALKQVRLASGEAICGRAFETGRAELYPAPETVIAARGNMTTPNRERFREAATGAGQVQSAVCIPLIAGETRIGALLLESWSQPAAFGAVDVAFLSALADLVAISIQNVRLQDELQAVRALEEANRLKSELISTLAHEMRTPLTSIKGYATALLMEDVTFSPETKGEFLQIIDEECDVLQDLIHDLLESSIIDAGLLKLESQPVVLPRLVQGAMADFTHRSRKHRFLIDFPAEFPIVEADPNRIGQVLRNLLDNAVKYSPQGGLVVLRGELRADEVVISVADQGVGIAPEHLNRLFEKYFRVRSGLGAHVVGSGLGLPIARTIVESHGGRIWAESQVGQGTKLCFTLPIRSGAGKPDLGEEQLDE